MLGVNFAFELAGSVPDIDGCGFLAGNLVVLLVLYPLLAAAISSRATSVLIARTNTNNVVSLRAGARIGGSGSALYFVLGALGVIAAPHTQGISTAGWIAAVVLTLACSLGGRLGAASAMLRSSRIAARESGR